jgi:hypothetical protein
MPPPIENERPANTTSGLRAQHDVDRIDHQCAGHHAIDARSVLGTVQGSSLRFDGAYARPVGLDAACAQTAVLAITRCPAV